MDGSIVSYPARGAGEARVLGNPYYHGNCAPGVIRDLILQFNRKRGLVIDPCQGSGTTGAVCAELGIPYRGFDLRDGFDSTKMRLRDELDTPATFSFVHSPYAAMVEYSRTVWGNGAVHPADLSRHGTNIEPFLDGLQDMLYNVFDALEVGAHYALLLGLWRDKQTKELLHLPARIFPRAPGSFVNEIIKVQHRTRSSGKNYGNLPFVLTDHETILVFKKTENSLVGSIFKTVGEGARMQKSTWKALIRTFARNKSTLTIEQVAEAFGNHPRARGNKNVRAKVRQILALLVSSGELDRDGCGGFLVAAA